MDRSKHSYRILMAGVVPPPIHGQSVATQALFDADLQPLTKFLVPIRSSKKLGSVGKVSIGKTLGLLGIIFRIWNIWLKRRPSVLYYTAGSGAWVPFVRDLVILGLCRPLFRRTLIHYHSGSLVDFVGGSAVKRLLGTLIYGQGAWTIRLGSSCPAPNYPDGRVFDLPNGLDAPTIPPKSESETFRILFIGNLYEDKGVSDLIAATIRFAEYHSDPIQLSLVGTWPNDATKRKIEGLLVNLPPNVSCAPPTPAYGDAKWQLFSEHDVFVFPSYYDSENLPLVIIEAMAASLPVIATHWRGISSLVENEKTGLLVPIRDVEALANALAKIATNPELSKSMGASGRGKYETSLTAKCHVDAMRRILIEACDTP